MPARHQPPAELQGRAFRLAECAPLGLSRHHLRSECYRFWGRGVYTVRDAPPRPAELVSAALHSAKYVALGGPALLGMLDLPLPARLESYKAWNLATPPTSDDELAAALPAQVICEASQSSRPHSSLLQWRSAHRTMPVMTRGCDGGTLARLTFLTPSALFATLARELTLTELVILGDAIVRHPRAQFEGRDAPYSTVELLGREAARMQAVAGAPRARQACELIRVGSDSPMETVTRLLFQMAQLPEDMHLNESITCANGVHLRAPDGAWPAYAVSWEYQGLHHGSLEQMRVDDAIRQAFRLAGWEPVYLFRGDLPDLRAFSRLVNDYAAHSHPSLRVPLARQARQFPAVRKVMSALRSRGWSE